MKKFYSLKFFFLALVFILTASVLNAQTRTASVSGPWNSTATWGGASVPTSANDVVINNGINVTIGVAAACNSLTINGGNSANTLTIQTTNSLTVTGAITINSGTGTGDDKTIAVGAGSLSCASISMATTGSDTRTNQITISTGTVTVSGNITMNDADVDRNIVSFSGAGTLHVAGNVTGGALTTATGSVVDYNGSAQTVKGTTYSTLMLSGSGSKTTTGVTINDSLILAGTATVGNAVTYSSAILVYRGSAAQSTTNNEFPATMTTSVIVDNAAGVTLNAAKSMTGNITLANGTLVAGNNLTIGTTGTPTITRNDGSMTGNIQGNNNYAVVYSGSSKTTGQELSGTGLEDVTVSLTAGETLTLDQNRAPDGDVSVTAGTFDLSTFTINRSATGGAFNVANGAFLKIGGTNTLPTNYTYTLNTSSTVEYYGANQTVGNATYANLTLSGSGNKNFTGARTVNATLSMQGTAVATGTTPTYGTNAILEYAGSAAQTTTNVEFPNNLRHLKINNSNGVTLHAARTVAVSLDLTDGLLNTNLATLNLADGATASNYSDNSFVNGPLSKTGNDAFVFPVGKSGAGLHTIAISTPALTASIFTAEFVRSDPHALGSTMGTGIVNISACEYWTLARTGSTSNVSVILSWTASSPCNSASYVSDPTTLLVTRLAGTTWNSESRLSTTGGAGSGTITSGAAVSNFNTSFALGTSSLNNALPVVFANVKAYEKNSGVQVEWDNLTEKDVINYNVERSTNGVDFVSINQQAPKSNLNDRASYIAFDASPVAGTNFYRVKAKEISGKTIYSNILKVDIGGKAQQTFTLYPNPVTSGQVSVSLSVKQGQYTVKVLNATGQEVYSQRVNHQGGSMTQTIALPSTVKSGFYNMVISGDNYRQSKMFVVQ